MEEDERMVAVRFRGKEMEILLSSVAKAEVKVWVEVGESVLGTGKVDPRTVEVFVQVEEDEATDACGKREYINVKTAPPKPNAAANKPITFPRYCAAKFGMLTAVLTV